MNFKLPQLVTARVRPALSGALCSAALLGLFSHAHAGQNVTLDTLPAAARASVERETKGLQILEIEKELKQIGVVYEVEYMKQQQRWELEVAEDGRILKHELD